MILQLPNNMARRRDRPADGILTSSDGVRPVPSSKTLHPHASTARSRPLRATKAGADRVVRDVVEVVVANTSSWRRGATSAADDVAGRTSMKMLPANASNTSPRAGRELVATNIWLHMMYLLGWSVRDPD